MMAQEAAEWAVRWPRPSSCFTQSMKLESTSEWFAVRCVFRQGWPVPNAGSRHRAYEERVTLWRARDLDEAIAKAEADAMMYAGTIEEAPDEYLGLAQAYALTGAPDQDGAEVFSLIRDSTLDPSSYLNAFFHTGDEHQRTTAPSDSD